MTLARRIIPCLDVDGGRVVKGIEFEGLRDMGDPADLAARYNREGADELVVLDISASFEGRATFLDTIRRVAEQLNIPLTAGGGIRTMEEGRKVLRAGADKVTVNTAAVERPELISELSQQFGAQAVVLSIDVKRKGDSWEAYTRGGPRSDRPRRRRMGRRSRLARRRRNSAHVDRSRRHLQRIRLRTHRQNRGDGPGAGDRIRRRQHVRGFPRRVRGRPRRRRARGFDLPHRNAFDRSPEKIPGGARSPDQDKPMMGLQWDRRSCLCFCLCGFRWRREPCQKSCLYRVVFWRARLRAWASKSRLLSAGRATQSSPGRKAWEK